MRKPVIFSLVVLIVVVFIVVFAVLKKGAFLDRSVKSYPEFEPECKEIISELISKSPRAFQSNDKAVIWCTECRGLNGIPALSKEVGPFCNPYTADSGAQCKDSDVCEGVCLAENKRSAQGACSETKFAIGCVLEMSNAGPSKVCFD